MVVIAVILATAFVVGLQTNVSSYVQNNQISSIYVWTSTKNNWTNITAINSGGDATDISGHVFLTYPNATTTDISGYMYFQYPNDTLHYPSGTLQYLKDGAFQYQNGTLYYKSGTLHYPNGTLQYPNGTAHDIQLPLSDSNPLINGDFSLPQLMFGQQFQVNIDLSQLSPSQLSQGTIHYIISSKNQILAEVTQNLETTHE